MPAQTDDELWPAIADPSRRQVLDLLVSNGEVSASWLAGYEAERAGLLAREKAADRLLLHVVARSPRRRAVRRLHLGHLAVGP